MFQVLKSGQSLAHSSSSTFKLNRDVPSKNSFSYPTLYLLIKFFKIKISTFYSLLYKLK